MLGSDCADVFALHVERLEAAGQRRVQHVRDAQARLRVQRHAPGGLELRAHRRVADVAVAGQLVREAAHVAGALHVVLATQRVHAHALAADVADGHGQVGDAHDHGRALAVLGDAQAVVDGRIAAARRTGAPQRARASAGTPVTARTASGEFSGLATKSRHCGKALGLAALGHIGLSRPGLRSRSHGPAR